MPISSAIRIGQPALPVLKELSGSGDPRIREYAAYALAEMRADASLNSLAGMSDDTSCDVRLRVAQGLAKGPAGSNTEILIAFLNDRCLNVRAEAARSLAVIGDPSSVNALAECLLSIHSWVAMECGRSLAILGKSALPNLHKLLASSDPDIRRRACVVLGWTGLREASPWVRSLLKDRDPSVVFYGIWALERLEGKESIPALSALFTDERKYMDKTIGQAALESVERLKAKADPL
jgi:HEAT repeat protein